MKQVLFRLLKLYKCSNIITKHKKTLINNKKIVIIDISLPQIARRCLNYYSHEDYCKAPFENFKQRLSRKLYYEDRNWMIRVKQMTLKVRATLFI